MLWRKLYHTEQPGRSLIFAICTITDSRRVAVHPYKEYTIGENSDPGDLRERKPMVSGAMPRR